MNDIGPTEALMLLCSYEKRTRETLDPKKMIKLSDLLTKEDFKMAHLVCEFYDPQSCLHNSYPIEITYPNFGLFPTNNHSTINDFLSLLL